MHFFLQTWSSLTFLVTHIRVSHQLWPGNPVQSICRSSGQHTSPNTTMAEKLFLNSFNFSFLIYLWIVINISVGFLKQGRGRALPSTRHSFPAPRYTWLPCLNTWLCGIWWLSVQLRMPVSETPSCNTELNVWKEFLYLYIFISMQTAIQLYDFN